MNRVERALALRVPPLEWAHRSGRGDLARLSWVDLDPDPNRPNYRERRAPGQPVFTQGPLLGTLPPSIAEHVAEQQAQGRATAWEGVALILARSEWLVTSRDHLWAPWSPEPRLLAAVAETFGVEPVVHGMRGEVLSRLAALLPGWHAHRGTLARALEVLDAAGLRPQVDPWLPSALPGRPRPLRILPHDEPLHPSKRRRPPVVAPKFRQEIADLEDETDEASVSEEPSPTAQAPAQVEVEQEVLEALPESDDDDATASSALGVKVAGVRRIDEVPEGAIARIPPPRPAPERGELLACRNLGWWLARTERSAGTELVITGGFTQLHRVEPPGPSEADIGLGWSNTPLPPALFRLLPPWAAVRLRESPDTVA